MKRTLSLTLTLFIFLIGSCSRSNAKHKHYSDSLPLAAASVHGMVLFGTQTLYMSHIPMFHAPHDYQALFEIELSHPNTDALAVYKKQLGLNGKQTLVTLRPRPFVLPDLLEGKLKSMNATLFKWNFEDGGVPVLTNVTVKIKNVIYKKQLLLADKPLQELTYLTLKDQNKVFLVHKITAPDNFDQIVETSLLNPDAAQLPVEVSVAGKTDLVQNKLFSTLQVPIPETRALLTVTANFYCAVGPHFTGSCPN